MAMELRGSLGLSKYHTKPSQPKFYGRALIEGVDYEIKGWEKVTPGTGEIWISLCFEEKKSEREQVEKRREEFAPSKARVARDYGDDDVPF